MIIREKLRVLTIDQACFYHFCIKLLIFCLSLLLCALLFQVEIPKHELQNVEAILEDEDEENHTQFELDMVRTFFNNISQCERNYVQYSSSSNKLR